LFSGRFRETTVDGEGLFSGRFRETTVDGVLYIAKTNLINKDPSSVFSVFISLVRKGKRRE
jgi:hypothetical protein